MTTDIQAAIQQAASRLSPVYPPPDTLEDTARQAADAAVEGEVIIHCLGEHRLPLGRAGIDWTDARFHHDASVARFAFLETLAAAYHVLRDERYAVAARDYLAEYMTCFPSDTLGTHVRFDNVLTLGIRDAAWCAALPLLAPSAAFDTEFLHRVVGFLAQQFQYLHDHLSTTINWRVTNARDLLLGSLYLAFLEPAGAWQRHAVRVLNDAWFRQFLPDGAHCERIPSYHANVSETYRDLYRLQCLLPELGLAMTLERLVQFFDFALATTKPSGFLCGIHDCQTDFTGHLRDDLAAARERGQRPGLWEDFRRRFDLPLAYPPTHQVFSDAGLSFFRTGWDEDAGWMSFDATHWGGGHCHMSRNAVQLHAFRQSMVIDPGWPFYGADAWSLYGCATRAHSTCNLNGLNQSSTNPSTFTASGAPGYDAAFCVYEGGYWDTERRWDFTHATDGFWAQHARILCWVQDRFAFVADSMCRLPRRPDDPQEDRPRYECVWQLAPGAEIILQPDRDRAVAQWRDAGLLLLTPIRPEGSRYELYLGETDPLRGWAPDPRRRWKPDDGGHLPAPQIVLNTPRMDRRHDYYVSILVPYQGAEAPGVTMEAKSPMGQIGYVRLRWADGTADEVHWGCNFGLMLGQQADFETDSSLVHLRKNAARQVTGGCCIQGTYLAPFSPEMRRQPETFTFPGEMAP